MPISPINISPPKLQPVILVARPAAGGIRSHLISLLTRLDRTKFCVTLAAPHSLITNLPVGLPRFNTFDLAILSQTTPLDIVASLQLTELIKATPGAIVHAHGVRAGFVCSIARQINSFCLVVTHHNIPPSGTLSRVVLELIDFGCASTVAVSNAIAVHLPGTDTMVIPNGIELSDYGKHSRCEAKAHFGLNADEFICAYLGRLSHEKGADLIIRTALMRPDIRFLIGGDGPEKERLVRTCPSNVKFLGRIPNPTLLLSAADVLLIPSRTEGQGMVALEAMASGTPVITSRVGGLIETVDESNGGILVDPESASHIALAIDQLRFDFELRQKLADCGKAWVQVHAKIADRIAEIEALYSSLKV